MENVWEKYKKIELINSNNFDIVYKGKNKMNNEHVTIVEIKKSSVDENVFLEEIELVKKLKSENFMKLIEIIETKESFYLISELFFLNLEQYFNKRREGLSIEEIKKLLIDLNKGFNEMNENKIIHGDIKPSNILLSLNKNNKIINYVLKYIILD